MAKSIQWLFFHLSFNTGDNVSDLFEGDLPFCVLFLQCLVSVVVLGSLGRLLVGLLSRALCLGL